MLMLLKEVGFFLEIHEFLKLSSIDLCGKMRAFIHLENSGLKDVFLSVTYSILTRKQWARCSCF
jgi:hypothetical protein